MNETMIHPETGEILYRDVREIEFSYKNEKITMAMPGWYPKNGNSDDGIFSMDDMAVHDKAIRLMKARHQQKLQEKAFGVGNLSLA